MPLNLQGGVEFPTGGIARERDAHDPVTLFKMNSGADSTVWMKEDAAVHSIEKTYSNS